MAGHPEKAEKGAWLLRNVPREVMRRVRAVAAYEGKTVSAWLLEVVGDKLKELERRGVFPKGK